MCKNTIDKDLSNTLMNLLGLKLDYTLQLSFIPGFHVCKNLPVTPLPQWTPRAYPGELTTSWKGGEIRRALCWPSYSPVQPPRGHSLLHLLPKHSQPFWA